MSVADVLCIRFKSRLPPKVSILGRKSLGLNIPKSQKLSNLRWDRALERAQSRPAGSVANDFRRGTVKQVVDGNILGAAKDAVTGECRWGQCTSPKNRSPIYYLYLLSTTISHIQCVYHYYY